MAIKRSVINSDFANRHICSNVQPAKLAFLFNLIDMVPGGFLKQETFRKFYTDKSINLSPRLKGEKKTP